MPAIWSLTVGLLAFLAVASGLAIVGGPTAADPSDQEVKDALQYAVEQTIRMRKTPHNFLRKLIRVGETKQQVVVGMLYVLTAEMATTNCTKGEEEKQCVMHEDRAIAFHERCTFHIWNHPITKTHEMMRVACAA